MELDETAAEALFTLDAVRGAQTQAENAVETCQALLTQIQQIHQEEAAARKEEEVALQKAIENAEAALAMSNKAQRIVEELDAAVSNGHVSGPNSAECIDSARSAMKRAVRSAGRAAEAAEDAQDGTATKDAAALALAALDETRAALAETTRATDAAHAAEKANRGQAISNCKH